MSEQSPPSTPAPPQKRRRLSAGSTLKKPFRSPLLNRPPGSTPAPQKFNLPAPPAPTTAEKCAPLTKEETPIKPVSTAPPLRTPRPVRRSLFQTPSADPELSAAQKQHSALLSQIRSAKQSWETVSQALTLEASPEGDEELRASIIKWRIAARAAAEALFGIAGDKVNAMGGPGGDTWRRMVGGSGGGGGGGGFQSWGWDEDEVKRGDEDEGGDEGIGGEDEKEAEEAKRNDTEEWGMGLMLKTLGIPENMLGWDREGDCWKDT
jgi:Swi5-dependent recombination DNA repair protein 1